MRLLVCGGRDFNDRELMSSVLSPIARVTTILIYGAAPGADTLAAKMWKAWGCPTEAHPADWIRYGKRAGPIRNQEMLFSGIDLVIAFPGGSGTRDMVERAKKEGVEVCIIEWPDE
jgi:YspA, cpYpsA-related SLOG family